MWSFYSHDFIGEFSTSYREMSRSQSQFHIYEVTFKWKSFILQTFSLSYDPHIYLPQHVCIVVLWVQ